ncbi:MAG: anti-sigma factor antagonist [Oscillospiraceae bacterium]|nr:anti-sigma factor antagonist [Oscillospiraceae bacterium]
MKEVSGKITNQGIEITLTGRIDSNNAHEAEAEISALAAGHGDLPVVIDALGLEYISSAGLRVLLHLKKMNPQLRITNVSSEVYEILDMTGFTQMMDVEKAYRVVSVEGCEEIGRGANGTIYRIDQDNVVKVYNNADALAEIQHEREVARIALVLGIPTAISYDVVRVGNSYGSVFELLNAQSFSKILETEPDKLDWCVNEFTDMLKKIHGTLVPPGKLPDMRLTAIKWAEFMRDYLPEAEGEKLVSLIKAVPHDDHMIHGDYHTKNLELQDDEVLIIDMDTLAVGHPIFELAGIYNPFIGFSEYVHDEVKDFLGIDYDTSRLFWRKMLARYLGTENPRKLQEVEDKARIVGYARLIRRSIRRNRQETERGKAEIELWTRELIELIDRTDTLLFDRSELELEAKTENLPEVLSFIERQLESVDCPPRTRTQICIAAEEIFVNIASYAYAPTVGKATVRVEVFEDPVSVTITFMDNGKPFDPLKREDPDVSIPAEERGIGGLGIFMTKNIMDDVRYEYVDGKNILTMEKGLEA